MNDVSEIVSNSTILINYLNNDLGTACIAQCQQLKVAKDLHYHLKLFGTTGPINVLVDKINFPQNDIMCSSYLSGLKVAFEKIFELENGKFELVQVSWATKNQLIRSKRFREVQCIDATCKTNNQNRPLACTASVDGENNNAIAIAALLASEKRTTFVFLIVSIGFLHGGRYLKSVSAFISDGDVQIISAVNHFIAIRVFNCKTRWRLCY